MPGLTGPWNTHHSSVLVITLCGDAGNPKRTPKAVHADRSLPSAPLTIGLTATAACPTKEKNSVCPTSPKNPLSGFLKNTSDEGCGSPVSSEWNGGGASRPSILILFYLLKSESQAVTVTPKQFLDKPRDVFGCDSCTIKFGR